MKVVVTAPHLLLGAHPSRLPGGAHLSCLSRWAGAPSVLAAVSLPPMESTPPPVLPAPPPASFAPSPPASSAPPPPPVSSAAPRDVPPMSSPEHHGSIARSPISSRSSLPSLSSAGVLSSRASHSRPAAARRAAGMARPSLELCVSQGRYVSWGTSGSQRRYASSKARPHR